MYSSLDLHELSQGIYPRREKRLNRANLKIDHQENQRLTNGTNIFQSTGTPGQ